MPTDNPSSHDAYDRAAEHLTEAELARRWRISPRTLQRLRGQGRAPAHLVIGRRIRYRRADVEEHEQDMLGKGGGA